MTDLLPTASVQIVNPSTGELLEEIRTQRPETLAECVEAIQQRQSELKEMLGVLEEELRRRLQIRGRKHQIFGDFEVAVKQGRESVWDADALEATLRMLVDEGVVSAGECTGLIKREPVVSRSEADKLANRLDEDSQAHVEACRTWRPKGQPKLTVTRSVALIEEGE